MPWGVVVQRRTKTGSMFIRATFLSLSVLTGSESFASFTTGFSSTLQREELVAIIVKAAATAIKDKAQRLQAWGERMRTSSEIAAGKYRIRVDFLGVLLLKLHSTAQIASRIYDKKLTHRWL